MPIDYSKFDGIGAEDEQAPSSAHPEMQELPKELDEGQCLVLAASENRAEVVAMLLSEKADPNYIDPAGWTALCRAVEGVEPWERRKVIELLIGAEADPNLGLEPAVCVAAKQGPYELVEGLVRHATLNSLTEGLVVAALAGNRGATKSFLEHKADPNHGNDFGATALHHWACAGDHEEVVRIVEQLLQSKANAGARTLTGHSPLHNAAQHGHVRVLELLLSTKAEVDVATDNGETPLARAAASSELECCLKLLEAGARVDSGTVEEIGGVALVSAAASGAAAIVKTLLDAQASPDSTDTQGRTALVSACALAPLEVVTQLLDAKASVDLRGTAGASGSAGGVTALHIALARRDAVMVGALLARGADAKLVDERGFPPLLSAVKAKDRGLVELLAPLGVDVCHAESGKTAVLLAAALGDLDSVALLVQHAADLRLRDKGLRADALGAAAANGRADVCAFLVKQGLDPQEQGLDTDGTAGPSAAELAERHGHKIW